MRNRVSKVEDLKEKLLRGELTPKQAKEILHERGFGEQESWKWWGSFIIVWAVYFILLLLPSLAKSSGLEFLEFFAQLPAFRFPVIVIYISVAILAIDIFFAVWMHLSHVKWGGLRESGETIIFYRKGPFIFMRHPGVFSFMVGGIFLPIALSVGPTFTLLSVAAIIIWLAYYYYTILVEEKINLEKWGDEYQRYMKEVPRFNFILGLWRLRKKSR
jgi:protein-S-isoprenylcysteine O-methyltransferase Ste14